MQHLRNIHDAEIDQWLDLAEKINRDLLLFEKQNIITRESFYKGTQAISQSIMHGTRFLNPFQNTEAEDTFFQLESLMKAYYEVEPTAKVMLPMTLQIILAGTESYNYLTDHLAEILGCAIADRKGKEVIFSDNTQEFETDEISDIAVEQINELIEKAERYAAFEDYSTALQCINELISMIEKFSKTQVLIIDNAAILNNKAFYLFCLGRLDEAINSINELLDKEPDYALGYHTKAEILDAQGLYNQAIQCMDKAIELDNTPDKIEFKNLLLSKI